jgi:mannose-6-phosphate isomerase
VAIDEMDTSFNWVRRSARLWPQTERIKAAAALAALEPEGGRMQADALAAAQSLWRYLETPVQGLWRDRQDISGGFLDEPAPASSLYHILGAVEAIGALAQTTAPEPVPAEA